MQDEKTFRLLFASSPLPMWVFDLDSLEFIEVNDAAVAHYGYSREEFLKMRVTDIRPPEEVRRLKEDLEHAALVDPHKRRDAGTWKHRLKDGRIREMDISVQTIHVGGRRTSLVVARDITELKETQRALAKSTERLSILHDIHTAVIAAEEPVAIAEPALRRLRELLGVPRAILNLFELEKNEADWLVAIGRNRVYRGPGIRFPIEYMGDLESLHRGELQLMETASFPPGREVDHLLGSGIRRYVVVPMIAKGELIGGLAFGNIPGELSPEHVSIAREVAAELAIAIAQARLYEREKRHSEELERRVQERTAELNAANEQLQREIAERRRAEAEAGRASRLKSEFLANMSHELRTPLNAILGFTELINDDLVTPDMPQYKDFLGDILASGRHLLQLINDILDLSKIEAGKLDFHPEAVDVGTLIGEVMSILHTTVASKSIRLESTVDPSLTGVFLDAARFKQVLYNYISNALKFTPPHGHVVVRTLPEEGGAAFRLEVEDSGIGIAPENIDRLFVEFQQLDTESTTKGTGLGLALTKRLVEAQGGSVGVRSALGRGSTFHAVFPRQAPQGSSIAEPQSYAGAYANAPAVLVIEDAERDQAILVKTLRDAGYAVETAATGAQALTKCRERTFDAITLDLLLPDMSGIEVLRAIRGDDRNRDTRVIVITVVTERGAVAGFAVHDLLVKPIDSEALLASLKRAGLDDPSAGTVLVVDDDAPSLRLMAATLAGFGYPTTCVLAGDDGLRVANETPPIAVVLDLMMPHMDGFEFLDRFRQLPHCRRVPVIVWTVKDLTVEEHLRLRASAQGIVNKGHQGSASAMEELKTILATQR